MLTNREARAAVDAVETLADQHEEAMDRIKELEAEIEAKDQRIADLNDKISELINDLREVQNQ